MPVTAIVRDPNFSPAYKEGEKVQLRTPKELAGGIRLHKAGIMELQLASGSSSKRRKRKKDEDTPAEAEETTGGGMDALMGRQAAPDPNKP